MSLKRDEYNRTTVFNAGLLEFDVYKAQLFLYVGIKRSSRAWMWLFCVCEVKDGMKEVLSSLVSFVIGCWSWLKLFFFIFDKNKPSIMKIIIRRRFVWACLNMFILFVVYNNGSSTSNSFNLLSFSLLFSFFFFFF